jgi:hypothetical protein
MRSLSPAEVRVIGTLLADNSRTDADAIRASGVPRSTFQTIRRRALVSGWLKERYIPNPSAFGFSTVRVRLVQPFADRWRAALEMLRANNPVILWTSSETMFSVEFLSESLAQSRSDSVQREFRQSWIVDADSEKGGVAAYFDFEGVWSRSTQGMAPVAYPRAFSGSVLERRKGPSEPHPLPVNALQELLLRPFEPASASSARISFSQGRLPRRLRRLLDAGLAFRRLIPDLAEMPRFQSNPLEHVIFVTGQLRPGQSANALFDELLRESRAVPFLFLSDPVRILLAGLGPAPPSLTVGRTPILKVLEKYVQQVEIVRDRINSLVPVVDHRYDRLALQSGP